MPWSTTPAEKPKAKAIGTDGSGLQIRCRLFGQL
jgi:hypothetical protein